MKYNYDMLMKPLSKSDKTSILSKNKLISLEAKFEFIDEGERGNKALSRLVFAGLLFFVFLTLLTLNTLTPLIGDDYVYSFIYQTDQKLLSFNDVINSQFNHYYKWGGRTVVHIIDQCLLLNYSPIIADTLNSIAFIAYIIAIYFHITARKTININLLVVIFTLVWFIQPVFAETVLWLTGSSNYLWGTLLILLFLLPYRFYKNTKQSITKTVLFSAIMLLSGVISGWTNENTAAAMIIMIIAYIYYYKTKKWDIPIWAYAGLIGSIIGYTLMIIAPGNFVRASEAPSLSAFLIIYRLLTYTQRFIVYLGLLNFALIIALILYKRFSPRNPNKDIKCIIIYFVGIFVSIYIMIASPSFPARAWFGTITFNIIAFGIVYQQLNRDEILIRRIKTCLFIFLLISFSASYYDAYKDTSWINQIWKEREAIIAEKKQAGETTVTFKEYQAKTKFGLGDTYYALPNISKYYGINFELEK